MKPKSKLLAFLALAGSSLLAVSSASAQTWTPTAAGTYNWNNASSQDNWGTGAGGAFPNGIGAVANLGIDIAGAQTINLNAAITLGSLTYGDLSGNSGTQTIQNGTGGSLIFNNNGSGATLTMVNTAAVNPGNVSATITLNDNLAVTNNSTSSDKNVAPNFSGKISGTGRITLNAGMIWLSNTTNDYSGGFTLNGATARVVTGANSNAFGSGTITLTQGTIDTSFSGAAIQLISTTNANVWNGGWTMAGNWYNDGNVTLGNDVTVTRGNGQFLNLGGNITETGGIRALTFAGGTNASIITNLAGTNSYTGGTVVNTGSVNFLSKSAMPDTGSISFATGTAVGIALGGTDGWSSTGTGAGTLNGILAGTGDNGQTITYTSAVGLNLILTGSHSYDAIGNLGSGATSLTLSGTGSLTINGDNTNTGGNTFQGGGSVTLNYDTSNGGTNATKLLINGGNGSVVFGSAASGTVPNQGYGGGTITLKGGSTNERASSTGSVTLNEGGTFIVRDGGTSTIRFNAITRAAGGTISFSEGGIVNTDTSNFGTSGANGILGGWATIGNHWAVSAASAADTNITALASYDTWTNSAGSATANYLLTGTDSLAGALAAGTIKITDSGAGQSLDLNGSNLTITSTSATALGGLMYAGGTNGNYEIKNTGATARIIPSTGNQELIFAVQSGNLTVSALIGNTSGRESVTKTGEGRMIINTANPYRGALRVNQGIVQLTNASASGTSEGGIQVQNGAALELSGGLSFINDALFITGNGVSNGGALRNVSGANTYTGTISTGIGGARVNNDDTANSLTLSGAIATRSLGDLTVGGAGNTTASNAISGGGGVIKDGAGTLTLSAANTYIGDTSVTGGTLVLADNASLRFQIGDDQVNNGISGSGTINLNGDFIFDLTGASTTPGSFWNIVDVANLTETYGSTFQVLSTLGSFTEVSDVWSIVENGVTYQFTQTTGVLSVIPEPSSALLSGLLIGAGLLRRKRNVEI